MTNIERVNVGVRHIFKGDVFKSNGSLIGLSTQNFAFVWDKKGLRIVDLKEGFSLLSENYTFYIWEEG